MTKQHYNPYTKKVGICLAKSPETCTVVPIGESGSVPHFDSAEEAIAYEAKIAEEEFGATASLMKETFATKQCIGCGTTEDVLTKYCPECREEKVRNIVDE